MFCEVVGWPTAVKVVHAKVISARTGAPTIQPLKPSLVGAIQRKAPSVLEGWMNRDITAPTITPSRGIAISHSPQLAVVACT